MMAEVAAAASVYGLITGSIAAISTAIDIYHAVQNKSGIPERLRKVSESLPNLETILDSAKAQYDGEKLKQRVWIDSQQDFERCEELCRELRDLLAKAYPEKEESTSGRLWKSTKTVLSRKSRSAEQLLNDIWTYLSILEKKGIITNTTLLQEIKDVVDELSVESGSVSTFNHYGTGDQIAGDKISGNKNQMGNSGRMYNAPITTINEGTTERTTS